MKKLTYTIIGALLTVGASVFAADMGSPFYDAPPVSVMELSSDPTPQLGGDLDFYTFDAYNQLPKTSDAAADASTAKCGQDAYWGATGGNVAGGSCSLGGGIGSRKVQCTSFGATADGDTLAIAVTKDGVTTTTTLTAKAAAPGANEWLCAVSTDACCTALNAYLVANPVTGIASTSNATASYVGFVPSPDTGDIRLTITEAGGGGAPVFGTATNSANGTLTVGQPYPVASTPVALSSMTGPGAIPSVGSAVNMGLMSYGGADAANSGMGIYSYGRANGSKAGYGGYFGGGVTATGDTATAFGMQATSTGTHAGGTNTALYVSANNGATNRAIHVASGGFYNAAALPWELLDNSSTALTIGAAGATNILGVDTTNGAEKVKIGDYGTLASLVSAGYVVMEIGVSGTAPATGAKLDLANWTPLLYPPGPILEMYPSTAMPLAFADGTFNTYLEMYNGEFNVFGAFHGKDAWTDVAPTELPISGGDAYAQATGGNKTGANLYASGGIGSREYSCLDIASGDVVLTTVCNGTSVALTGSAGAGKDWLYGASCDASATNFCTAFNANVTLGACAVCTPSTSHAYLQPKPATRTLTIASDEHARTDPLSGTDGDIITSDIYAATDGAGGISYGFEGHAGAGMGYDDTTYVGYPMYVFRLPDEGRGAGSLNFACDATGGCTLMTNTANDLSLGDGSFASSVVLKTNGTVQTYGDLLITGAADGIATSAPASTDALPKALNFTAGDAWAQATGGNKVGANLYLNGGIGSREYSCLDIASGDVVLTTVVNGSSVSLTGGVAGAGWVYGATCDTSATNLCAAINGHATLGTYITCTPSTSHAYLQPKAATRTLTIATDQATRTNAVSGNDGRVVISTNGNFGNSPPLQVGDWSYFDSYTNGGYDMALWVVEETGGAGIGGIGIDYSAGYTDIGPIGSSQIKLWDSTFATSVDVSTGSVNISGAALNTPGPVTKGQTMPITSATANCTFVGGGGGATCTAADIIPVGATVIQISGRQVTANSTCTTCKAGADMGAGLDDDQYGSALECDVNDTLYTAATATANIMGSCINNGGTTSTGCDITMTAVGGNCVSGVAAWTVHYITATAATSD